MALNSNKGGIDFGGDEGPKDSFTAFSTDKEW